MRKAFISAIGMALLCAPAAYAQKNRAFPIRHASEASGKNLAEAFVKAFRIETQSSKSEATLKIDGEAYTFVPVAMHPMDEDMWVLLSTGGMEDAGHVHAGMNAIHYLRAVDGGWQLAGEWLGKGATGTFGNAATSWAFSDGIGKNPYLITSGGGTWQGCSSSFATVTELTVAGPVDRGSFIETMHSGAGIGQVEEDFEGQISSAIPDKSFAVSYSGSRSIKQQYDLKNGKYELNGKNEIPGC